MADTQLYISIPSWLSEVVKVMTQHPASSILSRLNGWDYLDPGFLHFYSWVGCTFTVRIVHNMWVFLDSQILLREHLAAVPRTAFAQAQLVLQLCSFLHWLGLQKVTYALVTWQLSYRKTHCLWSPLGSYNWSRMQWCSKRWWGCLSMSMGHLCFISYTSSGLIQSADYCL